MGHPVQHFDRRGNYSALHLQGTSKERFPGCVKSFEKVAFCLPIAGRRRNLFHPKFTKPGKHSLEVPCTVGGLVKFVSSVACHLCQSVSTSLQHSRNSRNHVLRVMVP